MYCRLIYTSFPTRRSSDLIVQVEKFVGSLRGRDVDLVEINALPAAAALEAFALPGAVDRDAAHGLGRRREEVAASLIISPRDRKSTRLNSSHLGNSYSVSC